MPGRRRGAKKRGWPDRLYERNGYFSWRSPLDGKEYGLGRDRQQAFTQAVEANLHVAGLLTKARLLDRITDAGGKTVADWCARYEKILADREHAPETRTEYARRLRLVRDRLGVLKVEAVTTKDVADFLHEWEERGQKRTAQAMRSYLLDLFREALAAGWIASNPVAPTRAARVVVQRARLTLEQFKLIHAHAVEHLHPWAARAMELALVTGQRREDIAAMGRKDVHDGRLWIEQAKTGARVSIPLELRLDAAGWSLAEVIERCQRKHVVARTFVHHVAHVGKAKPGAPVRDQSIGGAFAEARDAVGITVPAGKTPPTFHEIRSLAARLYTEQGVNAQSLLGHKSADMTAVYRDVRGSEWIEVRTA